ncbi:nuclear transport factor 2 family protein [Piscinibacter sp. XHJ-5]|uniref:nuclear transport factor 2 family protein n=1 Tax=Piscinibacter sp. XHJ-5 TaxID=3037797 RepID=UPI0024535FAF|nr:nuclear transport factor 2 family protein [Piscinibacter sp. XHJ-5]
MDTESNKRLAIELLARFSASDIAGVLDCMTDDATWLIPGKPEASPAAGLYDKRRIGDLFHIMLGRLKNGLALTVDGVVAEGHKVAVEARSQGELTNGNVYRQHYHILMEFRDGKVCAVREYLDTQHAHAVWFGPGPG